MCIVIPFVEMKQPLDDRLAGRFHPCGGRIRSECEDRAQAWQARCMKWIAFAQAVGVVARRGPTVINWQEV
jgi:hypothetical protein